MLLKKGESVSLSARIAAYLPAQQDSLGEKVANTPLTAMPFWDIERARVGKSRNVRVELIVNGESVDTALVAADGKLSDIRFTYKPVSSVWAALRIYPSSHSNPVFIKIDNKPIAVKSSAEWCIAALNQCWKMKEPAIRTAEKGAAQALYEKARKVYQEIAEKTEN